MGWGLGFGARAVSHQHALQRAPELRKAQVEYGLEVVRAQPLEVLAHKKLEVSAEFVAVHRAIPVVELLQEAPHPLKNTASHTLGESENLPRWDSVGLHKTYKLERQ